LWLADGWTIVQERGWNRPLCWSQDLDREYTLGGWRALDHHAPVCHVSLYEAAAFAAWAGSRLPTEEDGKMPPAAATPSRAICGLPAGCTPRRRAAARQFRKLQIWGDVWEWCASAYRPYPRFRPLAARSANTTASSCNQWVARGSCVTPPGHVRSSYRNFFYPQDRWQFLDPSR
jgi:formylglycine-generating enzyme required for sulfatase activity